MNIYVGNIDYSLTEDALRTMFEPFGEVHSAKVIKDKFTGQSKGFGFIVMNNDDEAQAAIDSLNGTEVSSRKLTVNKAREATNAPRPFRSAGSDYRR